MKMAAALWLALWPLAARAQDTRAVSEPVIPPVCARLSARLAAGESVLAYRSSRCGNLDGNLFAENAESRLELVQPRGVAEIQKPVHLR